MVLMLTSVMVMSMALVIVKCGGGDDVDGDCGGGEHGDGGDDVDVDCGGGSGDEHGAGDI